MIPDRLVVGLRNDKHSDVTANILRFNPRGGCSTGQTSENVKKKTTRSNAIAPGSRKRGKPHCFEYRRRPRKKTTSNKLKQPSRVSGDGPENYMPDTQITRGERCGHHQNHNSQTFPAKDARCHKCSKQDHFTKCCHAKSRVNMVNEVELAETSSSDSEVSLAKSAPTNTSRGQPTS